TSSSPDELSRSRPPPKPVSSPVTSSHPSTIIPQTQSPSPNSATFSASRKRAFPSTSRAETRTFDSPYDSALSSREKPYLPALDVLSVIVRAHIYDSLSRELPARNPAV